MLLKDALSTCFFCAENGLEHSGLKYKEDSVVVVIGCGPVGLMAIASSIYLGAKLVYAVDCIEERLKIAQEFSATTMDFLKCDVVKKIKELTDGRGADIVLEVRNNSNKIFRDFWLQFIT